MGPVGNRACSIPQIIYINHTLTECINSYDVYIPLTLETARLLATLIRRRAIPMILGI